MALICDTSGVYAIYDRDDATHAATLALVELETGSLLLPVVLLAEIDYLLHTRLGSDAAFDFIRAVEKGEFTLVPLTPPDLVRSRELVTEYRDLAIGLADATIVATAERLGIPRLLTHDQRHFRVIQPRGFDHFVLLPCDTQ